MDGRPTWTDCDEAGDYVVPNVLSPRDLVFRPDNMDKLYHTHDGPMSPMLHTNFSLPLGAWDWLCYFIVALPEPSI